jgi:hypothetical protein
MIAETIPEAYDAVGRNVLRPFDRRRGPHPTFPMGRYVSQPLTVKCENLVEVRKFLSGCKGVSDEEQFGQVDYWQPPEHFEQTREGDCDDYALWTWRQVLDLGYHARVVFGRHGRYGIGHAWVQFFSDDKCYLVEPQLSLRGDVMPRLATLRYHPKFSVAWDDEKLSYCQHADRTASADLVELARLMPEYFEIWGLYWIRNGWKVPRMLWRSFAQMLSGFRRRKPGR